MHSQDLASRGKRFGRWLAAGMAAMLLFAPNGATAESAEPDPVAEVIRKADAKEPDNGFCAAQKWPPGTRQTYVHFLQSATVGFGKINSFDNGTHCQFDRAVDIFQGPSGKCVRYVWWACATGKTCARGEDVECRDAKGAWQRQSR